MASDRWEKVRRLYQEVLERRLEDRSKFLESACAGNDSLRQEVEALLAGEGTDRSFLETSAVEKGPESGPKIPGQRWWDDRLELTRC